MDKNEVNEIKQYIDELMAHNSICLETAKEADLKETVRYYIGAIQALEEIKIFINMR